jgi:hypothetical protein
VDDLVVGERPLKMLRHYESVLEDPPVGSGVRVLLSPYDDVSVTIFAHDRCYEMRNCRRHHSENFFSPREESRLEPR